MPGGPGGQDERGAVERPWRARRRPRARRSPGRAPRRWSGRARGGSRLSPKRRGRDARHGDVAALVDAGAWPRAGRRRPRRRSRRGGPSGRSRRRAARRSSPRSCCSRWSRASPTRGTGRRTPSRPRRSTFSPAPTLEPPTHTASVARSFGPRVKNADCTRPLHGVGLDAAVAQQLVDVGVVGDDRVERARVLVGVELDQDLLHVSSSAARLVRCAVSRTRSRRGSANVM